MPITYPDRSKAKLKLAFAMGGGVSLGSFSGSALTEVIKLALLKIVDGTSRFGSVEVDVFAGASAGSMSIAVMLRALCFRIGTEEADAKQHLFERHPGLEAKWLELPTALQEDLVAAQVAQDLQERSWVAGVSHGIDIDDLLGAGDATREDAMRHAPGFLDAQAVYHLAKRLLLPPDGQRVVIDRRMLGQRCVFAPTLTNLTPLFADATQQFVVTQASALGLRDALRSAFHKDLRVFDLHFKATDPSVSDDTSETEREQAMGLTQERIDRSEALQMAREQAMDNARDLLVGAETRETQVAMLQTATRMMVTPDGRAITGPDESAQALQSQATGMRAMAAAFHASVQPVDLPSRWFRMHEGDADLDKSWSLADPKCWAEIAATAIASGAFPAAFQPAVLTRFSFEYGKQWPGGLEGASQHPFAYVDGGVFNNDPIRETFRLCSFMDAREEPGFMRYVVYVDPSVGPAGASFHVDGLREVGGSEGKFLNLGSPEASSLLGSLPRLASLAGSIVGMFIDQGRSRDADGVAQTRNQMRVRDAFRDKLRLMTNLIELDLAKELWRELSIACADLSQSQYLEMIPPGEGTVAGELRRVIRESPAIVPESMQEQVDTYVKEGFQNESVVQRSADWLWVHLCVYFDLLLGLEGKTKTTILAVTPYKDGELGKLPVPVKLLGDGFAAFAGFLWEGAQRYDFETGRYCAGFFGRLDQEGPFALAADHPWLAQLSKLPPREAYVAALRIGMAKLAGRAEEAIKTAFGSVASLALPILDLPGKLDAAIEPLAAERYSDQANAGSGSVGMEFVVLLNKDQNLVLDAPGIRDRDAKPVRRFIGGAYNDVLITWASFDKGVWTGGAVKDGRYLLLQVPGRIWDTDWAPVELPTGAALEKLVSDAVTHLRPVALLNLTDTTIKPTGNSATISMDNWKIWEGAAPLAQRLRLTNG